MNFRFGCKTFTGFFKHVLVFLMLSKFAIQYFFLSEPKFSRKIRLLWCLTSFIWRWSEPSLYAQLNWFSLSIIKNENSFSPFNFHCDKLSFIQYAYTIKHSRFASECMFNLLKFIYLDECNRLKYQLIELLFHDFFRIRNSRDFKVQIRTHSNSNMYIQCQRRHFFFNSFTLDS